MPKKILIVEDEEDILELIAYNLNKEGYHVHTATSGEKGLAAAETIRPDLILLDLMLPGINGLEVCRRLKAGERTRTIPLLMVTARGEEADIVAGLELGADDYVTKPFSPRVLLARIQTVLRRGNQPQSSEEPIIRRGDLTINPARHQVLLADKETVLTSTEFRILSFLAARPGWVFTRDQIVNAIHEENFAVTARSVDVQIVGLRKKLHGTDYIETVRGIGYRFKE